MRKSKKTPDFKNEAEERDMPYQSLIKAWLAENVREGRKAR